MADYRRYFSSVIQKHFPVKARIIIENAERYYFQSLPDIQFARFSGNPIDKRMDIASYFLAMMRSLQEQGESFESIRSISLEIAREYVRPKNPVHAFMKKLPVKLANTWIMNMLLKSLQRKAAQNSHPDGFVANLITDYEETYGLGYGFDILECGICKLYKKKGFESYATILCEIDEITTSLAGLQLIRKGTIARGATKCDFRYRKV